MAKQKNLNETVWAKKAGYETRQFKRQQLEAMGTDTPGGDSYDGWVIVDAVKEPKEVTDVKKGKVTKNDADNDSKNLSTTQSAAEPGADDTDKLGKDSSQGGAGN